MFLHCHAGISRSATVCIAYIMKHLAYDLAGAYDHVKSKRPRVSPNLHFMGQLVEFQKRLQCKPPSASAETITTTSLPAITRPTTPHCLPGASDCTVSSERCTLQQMHQVVRTPAARPSRLSLPAVCSKPQDCTTTAVSALIAADVATTVTSRKPLPPGPHDPQSISAPGSLVCLQSMMGKVNPTSVAYSSHLQCENETTSTNSLPSTPLMGRLSSVGNSPASWIHSHCSKSLQLSPCRVVASTDSCLDYRCFSITTNSI